MKTTKNLKNAILVTALTTALWLPFGAQAETGQTLTQLLVQKGVISQSEAGSLSGTASVGLVDLLVAKGVLNEAEAASLAVPTQSTRAMASTAPAAPATDEKPFVVKAKDKLVQSITFSGRIHGQWDLLSTDYDNAASPDDVNNFFLRRVYLGAKASFGEGLSGTINGNFGNGADGTAELEKALVEWEFSDNHTLGAGYKKVPFGYEETTSSSKIAAVERSVGTRYFTEDLDLGARHTGLFLSGEYESGLYFNLAATNAEANNVSGSSMTNEIAFWGQLGWEGEVAGGKLDAGVGAASIPDTLSDGDTDTVWDVYANFKTGNFNLFAEVLGGKLAAAGDAKPVSYTILPSFRITDEFELVGRFSHVDADGGIGADISSVFRRAPENGGARFDEVSAYYIGGNWYIRGNTLKLSAGYEWASFEDNLTGSQGDADVDGFRTRLQLLF